MSHVLSRKSDMKIVLDTNVLVSGIFWQGVPNKILEFWARSYFDVIATEKIILEYYSVIREIDNHRHLSDSWQLFIAENAIIVKDSTLIKLCRDPKDDMFINCALAGNADYIVSGDNDLLSLEIVLNKRIVSPSKFKKLFDNLQ